MRPIDHLVLPVTTLALARSQLTSLGFTVAPDAQHPFGTGNCCVFFRDRTYLEPIAVVDAAAAEQARADGLFFVQRVMAFAERRGEGFAMLALKSTDAEGDLAEFKAAGIAAGPLFRFSRIATAPDGRQAEIGVVLAYTEHEAAPEAAFFACLHLAPDVLFQPAYLDHENGATGVPAVAAVADDPAEFRDLLSAATGQTDIRASSSGLDAELNGQTVSVLTPQGFRDRYGIEPRDPPGGLLFAAFEVLVTDLDRAIGYAGPAARRHKGLIVVPPAPGLGAVLAFRGPSDG